jgi:hypothetical protein
MNTLQTLLQLLGRTQQLSPGYLTPVGTGGAPPNAWDTVVALKNQFDPFTLAGSPLPGMTNQVGAPNILLSPAWIASLAAGQDAIFLDDVSGNLNISTSQQPAYVFVPNP